MANILIRPGWHVPEHLVTPEKAFLKRREFLRQMGFTGAGLAAAHTAFAQADAKSPVKDAAAVKTSKVYPAPRHPEFSAKWPLTSERVAGTYNNFYEFTTDKEEVHRLTGKFVTEPWPVKIGGFVEKPMTVDAKELVEMFGLEERVYRFRCVEAWAMVVPWTGFPLAKLIEKVAPKSDAKFVRFETAFRPEQMPGVARLRGYPWPYTEGLRMDEALHPLTMVVTGLYGKPLPRQNGAPLRLIVPWKYGYKSIKSIVKMDFVVKQPNTLWETLAPNEYPFESNVNPALPHPRWSQASERIIDTGERVRTLPFNGYGDYVAKLYAKKG
ncbi:MAG: protein-methionine-sulfoxide reductase catalytic subunit MsrP [Verrucomicrobia bacterium]|nr:protein-methionine-sulfoxide reductase catalytic subunit MsrP [Verrucomicrobiota bacterium]